MLERLPGPQEVEPSWLTDDVSRALYHISRMAGRSCHGGGGHSLIFFSLVFAILHPSLVAPGPHYNVLIAVSSASLHPPRHTAALPMSGALRFKLLVLVTDWFTPSPPPSSALILFFSDSICTASADGRLIFTPCLTHATVNRARTSAPRWHLGRTPYTDLFVYECKTQSLQLIPVLVCQVGTRLYKPPLIYCMIHRHIRIKDVCVQPKPTPSVW